MHRVDADAHVYETEATWEYMTEAEARYRPISFDPPDGKPIVPGDRRPHSFWMVDGRINLGVGALTSERAPPWRHASFWTWARACGTWMKWEWRPQVLYPTYLLQAPSNNPDAELAIYHSYNRWLADKTSQSNGRLRWVLMPPLRSMDEAIEELRFGKEHGACGVFKRAVECGGKGVTTATSSHFTKKQ